MRCENCLDIEREDGVPAPCHGGPSPQPSPNGRGRSEAEGEGFMGCPIPLLSAEEARILDMRGMIMNLKELVEAGNVLKMMGATLEDLRILAAIEEGLREKK